MKPGEKDLTEEQLLLAFRHLARPGWPADLQQALAHPLRGPAVRGLARHLSRTAFGAGVAPKPAGPPVPPTQTEPPTRKRARYVPPGAHDSRRAAANDFDD